MLHEGILFIRPNTHTLVLEELLHPRIVPSVLEEP
jgi:hypothetical protein